MEDYTYPSGPEEAMGCILPSEKKCKCIEAERAWAKWLQEKRITADVAFPRWKSLMTDKGFHTEADDAYFPVDR